MLSKRSERTRIAPFVTLVLHPSFEDSRTHRHPILPQRDAISNQVSLDDALMAETHRKSPNSTPGDSRPTSHRGLRIGREDGPLVGRRGGWQSSL